MKKSAKSPQGGTFLNKSQSVKTWRIPGIVQYQKELNHKLFHLPGAQVPQSFLDTIEDYLTGIENILHRHNLSLRDLSLSNQTAFLNLSGILDIERGRTSRYSQIYHIVQQVMTEFPKLKDRQLRLLISSSGRLSHAVKLFKNQLEFRISLASISMENEYFSLLAQLLFSRVLRHREKREIRQKLAYYENRFLNTARKVQDNPAGKYSAAGKYHNLKDIFIQINKEYFNGDLKIPVIGWSRKPSTRRLGYFDYRRNRLIVSSFLDNNIFPDYVIRGIVFHEMLHMIHPVRHKNGRRVIHGVDFKRDEKKFRHFPEYEKWLRLDYPDYIGNKKKRVTLKGLF